MHLLSSPARFWLCLVLLSIFPFSSAAFAMTHPGISHSQTDLDRLKNNQNIEPYKTAFATFAGSPYSFSTNTGQGPFAYETYGHGQFEIRNDAQVAHQNAVMWYVTGNKAYLNNAITIMMGWANTLTAFDQTDYLTAGTAAFDFANAGEIIRASGNGAWTPAQIATFENWMITYLYPPLTSEQAAGAGGLQIKGLVSMGIFCDRSDLYNLGIKWVTYTSNPGYSVGLQDYIDESGQNYETGRDQGHASGNIETFVQTFYMAYNQGLDLFGTDNNLLLRAYESQAKIDLGYNVAPVTWTSHDGLIHNSVSPGGRYPQDNLGPDLAYYIYHTVKGYNMPYTLIDANYKFPNATSSFYNRVDNSGTVPMTPLLGIPSPVDTVLSEDDDASGVYLVHLAPGSYTTSQLSAAGLSGGAFNNGSYTLSGLQIPVGWQVTLYDGDNFTGNSIVMPPSTPSSFSVDLVFYQNGAWNDRMASMKITATGGNAVLYADSPYIGNGGYAISVPAGSYNATQLNALGATGGPFGNGTLTLSWLQLPPGWTGTLYDGDNFTGNSLVLTSNTDLYYAYQGAQNDRMVSIKLAAGPAPYPALNGTYQVVNQATGLVADLASNAGNSGTGIVQDKYTGAASQLWRVEGTSNGQYRLLNLQSNLALDIPNGSTTAGTAIGQTTVAGVPNLATGGAAASNSPLLNNQFGSYPAANAFDGSVSTSWFSQTLPSLSAPVSLEYAYPAAGKAQTVTQYNITSAATAQAYDPATWQFLGSADGRNWVILDEQVGQSFSGRNRTLTYPIANSTAYTYYELNVYAVEGGVTQPVSLAELSFYSSQGGNPSQLWGIYPVPGTALGSTFALYSERSFLALSSNSTSSAAGDPLIQWYYCGCWNGEYWTLQVP